MPITHPGAEPDFFLIFQGNKYPISKCLFGLYSKRFRNSGEIATGTSIEIPEIVDERSFQAFVDGCQSRFYNITNDNCFDLLKLCTNWEVESIGVQVRKFIGAMNNMEVTILKLLIFDQQGEKTEELETMVAAQLNAALRYPSFLNLPLTVIHRVLQKADRLKIDHHLLMSKLLQLLQKNGSEVSYLFDFIDTAALTRTELQDLVSAPSLDQTFVRNSLAQTMDDIFSKIDSQNSVLDSIKDESTSGEKDKKLEEISGRIEHMEANIMKELSISTQPAQLSPEVDAKMEDFGKKIDDMNNEMEQNKETIDDLTDRYEELKNLSSEVFQKLMELQNQAKRVSSGKMDPENEKQKPKSRLQRFSLKESDQVQEPPKHRSLSMKEPDHNVHMLPIRTTNKPLQPRIPARQTIMIKPAPLIATHIANVVKPFDGYPLDGIFEYLTEEAGGNICKDQVINITTSSTLGHGAESLVNFQSVWHWSSENKANQWVCFDFKNMKLTVTNYTIKASQKPQGSEHPKSWCLEGTHDIEQNDWIVIDKRENTDDLNGRGIIKTFDCQCAESFRYLRIRSTGLNHSGTLTLMLANVEFFGRLSG